MVELHWIEDGARAMVDIRCRNGQTAHVTYKPVIGKGEKIMKWHQVWNKLNGKPKNPQSAASINKEIQEKVKAGYAVSQIIRLAVAAL